MKLKSKILIGFILALIILIISGYLSYQSAENTINDNLVRRDINNFIKGIIQLSSDYYQTEAVESYFVLTNENKYLDDMIVYDARVREDLEGLKKNKDSVLKEEEMKKLFEGIEMNINNAISDNEENVDIFKKKNPVASKNVYKVQLNEEFKMKIGNNIDDMIKRLEQFRYEVNAKAVSEANFTKIAIPAGTILALLILFIAFMLMRYHIAGKEKAENKLRGMNENLEKAVSERTENLNYLNSELYKEIEKRGRIEKKLHKLNSIYLVLSSVNQAIVRIPDKKKLLDEVCRILVNEGGMTGAWVGLIEGNTLKPFSYFGIEEEFIRKLIEPSNNFMFGEGLTGMAINTGKCFVYNDIENIKLNKPLKEEVLLRGIRSVCAIPLKIKDKVAGNLSFSSLEKDFFDETEIELLDDLAMDISFAIESMDLEEKRKITEEKLKLSEFRYRSLFENMVEGYALCRMHYEDGEPVDWTYLSVNDSFEKLTGLKEVTGKRVSQVIPNIRKTDPIIFEIYSRVCLSGVPEKFEFFVEALKMWFSVSVYSTQKEYFVAVFDVITERKQNEIKIRHLNRVYAILSNINNAIVRIQNKKQLLDEVCRVIVEDGKAKMVWIGFIDNEKVKPYSIYGFENGYLVGVEVSTLDIPAGRGPAGSCAREGKYVSVNDIKNDPRMEPWREKALERDYLSVCSFPLKVNSKVIGTLTIYASETDFYDDEEIKLMDGLAGNISFALESIELEEKRRAAERKLNESESRLRRFYESGMLGVIYWNMDGQITDANDKFLEIVGYSRDELEKGIIKWTELTPPEYKMLDEISSSELKNTGINKKPVEKEYFKKNGTRVPIIIAGAMFDDERFNGVAFVLDNTERKEAEYALIDTDKELRTALSEKEILLKEIHHRVKNNLQIVTSLLNMQSDLVKDKVVNDYFKISADRVRAMALIHQQLYRSVNLSSINFEYYLKDLIYQLYKLYCTNPDKIKINISTRGVTMDIDNAVPCGLMINEIVTNAFKHAFPDDRKGVININMKMHDEEYILKISDDGVGMPVINETGEKKGLGNDLIKMLSDQLDAEMEIKRENGTEYIITFKTLTYKKRV